MIKELSEFYIFRRPYSKNNECNAVKKFLEENPDLVELLKNIAEKVKTLRPKEYNQEKIHLYTTNYGKQLEIIAFYRFEEFELNYKLYEWFQSKINTNMNLLNIGI